MLSFSYKNGFKDSIFFVVGLLVGGCVVGGLVYLSMKDKSDPNTSMIQSFNQDKEQLDDLKHKAERTFDAIILKIADLQGQAITMDVKVKTVAESLNVALSDEDNHRFMASYHLGIEQSDMNLYAALASLEYRLLQRAQQLQALEELSKIKVLTEKTKLAGTAQIVRGWISSRYGSRIDPLTGARKWHSGVDIGSHHGTEVHAVATGIITFAGEKGGYGNTLEISHGDGLLTRYGHNQSLLVKEGDVVHKGTAIALVGSTGRATGPHVHFEVREHGLAVDPAKYYPQFSKKT